MTGSQGEKESSPLLGLGQRPAYDIDWKSCFDTREGVSIYRTNTINEGNLL